MQEILVDGDQLVTEDSVEMLDNADVAFHNGCLPQVKRKKGSMQSLALATSGVKPKLLNTI
jgi:hypothetical protein